MTKLWRDSSIEQSKRSSSTIMAREFDLAQFLHTQSIQSNRRVALKAGKKVTLKVSATRKDRFLSFFPASQVPFMKPTNQVSNRESVVGSSAAPPTTTFFGCTGEMNRVVGSTSP